MCKSYEAENDTDVISDGNEAGGKRVPVGGPRVSRMTMAWTTRMCIVAVSPVVQRKNT